jgi:transposase
MQTQFRELTDAQWSIICPLLPVRKRKSNLRLMVGAITFEFGQKQMLFTR